jgi:hypothetical protein
MDPSDANRQGDALLMRIISGSTALAFAAILGSVSCVERNPVQGLVFHWRWAALFWMAGGAAAGWYLWQAVWAVDTDETPRARRRLLLSLALLAAGGIAVFVFPIVFVPAGQVGEVLTGLIAAVLVLSFVGWMIFRLGKVLSDESPGDTGRQGPDQKPSARP